MYVLDSNVFIDAKNRYYGFDIAPVFWEWIGEAHGKDSVYSIRAVNAELRAYEDELSMWAANTIPREFFLEPDARVVGSLGEVSRWAASNGHFTDAAVDEFLASADLQLVACAHAYRMTAVSLEKSNPDRRNRIMVPDVCRVFNVRCVTPFEMLRALGARFEA